jgi:hypothetical protein
MDVHTQSRKRVGERRAKKLDGYTVHVLSRDGSIATIGKKGTDGTRELTVEVRDRRGERRIPADIARNLRSGEFTRTVGEMKTRLLRRPAG